MSKPDPDPTSEPVTALPNIGPALSESLATVGIVTVAEFRALGADATYAKLLRAGSRPHFIAYYVLEMALQGRPWNACKGAEKAALRKRFDAIKAEAFDTDRAAFEAMMDALGVIERPQS